MNVRSIVADVNRIVRDAAGLQHIAETNPGPLRATHRTHGPLIPRCRWIELAATIASTLDRQPIRVVLELLLQLRQREGARVPTGLALDSQGPFLRIDLRQCRGVAVVADEKPTAGRHLVVQQMRGRLRVHGAIIEINKSVLALNGERLRRLRQSSGDQTRRHLVREHDPSAQRCGHRSKPALAKESPA